MLRRTGGLVFWRLLGTGRGSAIGPGADLRRAALFALWRSEADLDRFEERMSPRWSRLEESYHLRMTGAGGHGSWRSVAVAELTGPAGGRFPPSPTAGTGAAEATADQDGFDPAATAADQLHHDGPIAVLTRAEVRLRHLRAFAEAATRVNTEVQTAPGLLAVCGIGEAPIARQATFSLWRSAADMQSFAGGRPHHRDAVRRTRRDNWYGEELFARFRPLSSHGTWDGVDPLARTD